jgi:outer membrane protein TolC
MKTLAGLIAWSLISSLTLPAEAAQTLDETLLSKLRNEAARNHPAAVASLHRAAAAGQDVRAVRLWDDPMAGLSFMAAEEMMRADDGDIAIGIEQKLPKPGLYEAARGKAESMHRAEVENAQSTALAVGAAATRDAIELALADESIALQRAQISWLSEMAENAKQMAADPMGSSTDALRMETELAKERQMLDAALRTREAFAQKLNLTLGRALDSPWPALKLPATPPPVPIAQAEIARIPHANPKIRAMREMVGAARAETRMADRERLPEVSVGVDVRAYSGGEFRSAMVGVKLSLPWFNESSYQAKIDAAHAREVAAGRDVETMRRETAAMVLAAATEAANAAAQARAFSGEIYNTALQATRTIEASWISSKAPLSDLLDASRSLFAIRLEQRRFIAMQLAALEELRTLVPAR